MNCIVFDLGGVLCQINRDWQSAMKSAGLAPINSEVWPLSTCPGFDGYQRGTLGEHSYLQDLVSFLNLEGLDQAVRVHQAILNGQYPGASELINGLKSAGHSVGVLSNTNDLHWRVLTDPEKYPAIASADFKIASQVVKCEKPEPMIYREFESSSGFNPDSLVFFDDHQANVDGAVACGWKAFLIDPYGDTVSQMRKHLGELGIR